MIRWGHFAAILDRGDAVLAFVDHCRSYPVFYSATGEGTVSNSARQVKAAEALTAVDETAALEFAMAGYVTGSDTIFEGLHQLQAGELLLWDRTTRTLTLQRYFRYYPNEIRTESPDVLTEDLHAVTKRVMRRLAETAGGRPIWIPLSGGLDSRLILCRLKELGYDSLQAFSYGPPGNHEARIARRVADRLEVPWLFVPSRMAEARRFFATDTRRQFWSFADGLSTVPNSQDLLPLDTLRRQGRLPEDAVLVNGQSGDFTSGGHIPAALAGGSPDLRTLLDALSGKHYSLWLHLKTPANLERIETKILRLLDLEDKTAISPNELSAHYEWWEWQERQSKYVVHGQRIYDFLGLAWQLPLWDAELLRFWQDVPVSLKSGQALYKSYLRRYDYRSAFADFDHTVWRWPGATIAIIPVARLAGLALGGRFKDKVYNYAKYVGHYRNHYATVDLGRFLKHAHDARNALAFYVIDWLHDNAGIESFPR